MHHVHADAMGWWVDPGFVCARPNLESHRDQPRIVSDIVANVKVGVFRQVRDRLCDGTRTHHRILYPGWDV